MSIKNNFIEKNQKAKTYRKIKLTDTNIHETLQELFIIENTTKTIDSPLNT